MINCSFIVRIRISFWAVLIVDGRIVVIRSGGGLHLEGWGWPSGFVVGG